MKPSQFEYFAPETVEEVVSLLEQYGDESKILAGGQSLVPLLALRLAIPEVVIDINRVSSLDYLRDEDPVVRIGALTRHRAIENHVALVGRCPIVGDAVRLVGHVAIRNRGTVVGSMAHADPASEWPALALALDAEFDVIGADGTRKIPVDSFFQSFLTTSIEPNELVAEVRFKIPTGRVGSSFLELARRHGDFAVAGAGSVVKLSSAGTIEEARVVLIGVGATALRMTETEQMLVGQQPGAPLFKEAAEHVRQAIEPSGDIHGSADYRRAIAGVLAERSLASASERAEGGGDHG